MNILNIVWSYVLLIIFPNVTGKYILHPTFDVRMYQFYGHFNAYIAGITLFSFVSSK